MDLFGPYGVGSIRSLRRAAPSFDDSVIMRLRRCCRRLCLLVLLYSLEWIMNACGHPSAKARDSLTQLY